MTSQSGPSPASDGEPSLPAEIDTKEKAKMEYQLHLDLQKNREENCYKLQLTLLEKGLLAFIGFLLLCSFNSCQENRRKEDTEALERYKLDEARNRFFIERQLDAMFNIATAMSDVMRVYFLYTKEKKTAPDDETSSAYDKPMRKAREAINASEAIFDEKLTGMNPDLDRYFEVHRALSHLDTTKRVRYRVFAAALSVQFDELCQAALRNLRINRNRPLPRLSLADIPFEERDQMSPEEYLEKHFTYWKSHTKRSAD